MITNKVGTEVAIQIYTIALAYLYDAEFDTTATAVRMHVREISRGVFYFMRRHLYPRQEGHVAIAGLCTYHKADNIWQMEFADGKSLTLLDVGAVWEIVEEKKTPFHISITKKARSRTQQRKHAVGT